VYEYAEVGYTKRQIETGNKRLLMLATKLGRVKPERFDYSRWVGEDWEGNDDLSCGTTACALGWATTMPQFRKLGLKMYFFGENRGGFVKLYPKGGNLGATDSFEAGARVFYLTKDESHRLFSPDYGEKDATPKQVAKKIREFVKDRRASVKANTRAKR
jgi:hypothetical protein